MGHGPAQARERPVATYVDDDVIAALPVGEVLACVVDDVVCADRLYQVHLFRAADSGHVGTVDLGDLHGEGAHAARRTRDQHALSWLQVRLVTKGLQGGGGGTGHGGGLLEGEVRRFGCEPVRINMEGPGYGYGNEFEIGVDLILDGLERGADGP